MTLPKRDVHLMLADLAAVRGRVHKHIVVVVGGGGVTVFTLKKTF